MLRKNGTIFFLNLYILVDIYSGINSFDKWKKFRAKSDCYKFSKQYLFGKFTEVGNERKELQFLLYEVEENWMENLDSN